MPRNQQGQETIAVQRQQAVTQNTIRLMQLVEMSNVSIEQEIINEVDENPALEIDRDDMTDIRSDMQDDVPSDEYDYNGDPRELTGELSDEEVFDQEFYDEDARDDYETEREVERRIAEINAPDESRKSDSVGVYCSSQREQWQQQLDEMPMNEHQSLLAKYLLGCLDDDGYLSTNMQVVVNDLMCNENVMTNRAELESVLKQFVQELDPPGVGARNLQECLLLQLNRMPHPSQAVKNAILILETHFDAFSMKHYARIQRSLSMTEHQLAEAIDVITKLDPRPGDDSTAIETNSRIITPDFIITSHNGKLQLSLNNMYIPKIRINKEFSNEYRFMTAENMRQKRSDAEKFLKTYVEKGEQFITMLTLREQILFNTMYAIMLHQEKYFQTGDDAFLKPMILNDIAQKVNLDQSTISRFSNDKYVQTDFGIIHIKHLFSESVNNEDTSSKEIKSVLKDFIDNEDKRKPLPDDKLQKMLKEKGYDIARRTVAKYRDQLNIPVARLRKEL